MKQTDIAVLLPGIYRRAIKPGSPLSALLEVMEMHHVLPEEVLANLDLYFDPYLTPDSFVPFLAAWMDLDRIYSGSGGALDEGTIQASFPSGLGRLRDLIASAHELYRWRGTAKGLKMFLETATGVSEFIVDEQVWENGAQKPFRIIVRAPAAARPYERLIRRIVELEKPAYIKAETLFEQRSEQRDENDKSGRG